MTSQRSTSSASRGDDDGPRTRGGWIPAGTAAQRRSNYADRGTERGQRTRLRLLEAARRVFERVGYFDATIDDIISDAGVARGSFYTYFPDKLAIFRIVAAEVSDAVLDAVSSPTTSPPGLDPIGRLDASNRQYIAAYRRNAKLYGLIEQLATMDPTIHQARLDSRISNVDRVTATIRRWQSRGLADPTIDAPTSAALLIAMTSNFCYWWFVAGECHDDEQAANELTNAWVRVTGLRSRPRRGWQDRSGSIAPG